MNQPMGLNNTKEVMEAQGSTALQEALKRKREKLASSMLGDEADKEALLAAGVKPKEK